MIDWQNWLDEKVEKRSEKGSHIEKEPFTFHPSQLGYCKRQAYLSKLGIKKHDNKTLRIFEVGNLFHEYIQHLIKESDNENRFEIEKPLTTEVPSTNNITLVGHCDLFDNKLNIVYDFKTRKNWNYFEPPEERHMIQLHLYQYMLWRKLLNNDGIDKSDSIHGQVVYICKSDMEIRQYPKNNLESFNPQIKSLESYDLAKSALEKANDIGLEIEENGLPTCKSEIPFSHCECWVCKQEKKNNEELLFNHL